MKVLFIEPYPIEGPSSRYRVEQYIPYLTENGIKCTVRPFICSKFYKIIYKKGAFIKKILFFIQSCIRRFFDFFTAMKADIIFIHLEAFPLGPPVFEMLLALFNKRIIYDLDDAIFLKKIKVNSIIKMSRYVITCNEYLADYVRRLNKNVKVIHTPIDTDKFFPKVERGNKNITIGWIGTHSTAHYLEQIKNVFSALGEKYKFDLKIIGAGDYNIGIRNVNVLNIEWKLGNEIEQFQSLDIGIYPLPEDKWALGKTGFKTIQYMSVGVPCVVSNVGSNADIVYEGVNGFLAKTENEWIQKLEKLILDPGLRKRVGEAGRRTAEEKFSLKVNSPKFKEVLEAAFKN